MNIRGAGRRIGRGEIWKGRAAASDGRGGGRRAKSVGRRGSVRRVHPARERGNRGAPRPQNDPRRDTKAKGCRPARRQPDRHVSREGGWAGVCHGRPAAVGATHDTRPRLRHQSPMPVCVWPRRGGGVRRPPPSPLPSPTCTRMALRSNGATRGGCGCNRLFCSMDAAPPSPPLSAGATAVAGSGGRGGGDGGVGSVSGVGGDG